MGSLGFLQGAGSYLGGYNAARAKVADDAARDAAIKAEMEARSQDLYFKQQAHKDAMASDAADRAERAREHDNVVIKDTEDGYRGDALKLVGEGGKLHTSLYGAPGPQQQQGFEQLNAAGASNPYFSPLQVPYAPTGEVSVNPSATMRPGALNEMLTAPTPLQTMLQAGVPRPALAPSPMNAPTLRGGIGMPWEDQPPVSSMTALSQSLQPPPIDQTQSGADDVQILRNPLLTPTTENLADIASRDHLRSITPGNPLYDAAQAPKLRQDEQKAEAAAQHEKRLQQNSDREYILRVEAGKRAAADSQFNHSMALANQAAKRKTGGLTANELATSIRTYDNAVGSGRAAQDAIQKSIDELYNIQMSGTASGLQGILRTGRADTMPDPDGGSRMVPRKIDGDDQKMINAEMLRLANRKKQIENGVQQASRHRQAIQSQANSLPGSVPPANPYGTGSFDKTQKPVVGPVKPTSSGLKASAINKPINKMTSQERAKEMAELAAKL